MRFLPMVVIFIVLLGLVVLMSGDRRKGLHAIGKMAFMFAVLLLMAALFAVVTDQQT